MSEIQLMILSILFFSSLIRSTFGFGDALIAMPLLSMVIEIHLATPLVALISTTISGTLLIQNWRQVHFKSVSLLIIYTMIGIPVGLLMLKGMYENVMKLILASVIILFSLYKLAKPNLFQLVNDKFAYVFGISAGILGGAYNTNGPPIVIYGTLRRWNSTQLRATLQGYLFPTGFMIALGHGIGGLWTQAVLFNYALSLPVVVIAIGLGTRLHRQIPTKQFDSYIYFCLIIVSVILLIDTLR